MKTHESVKNKKEALPRLYLSIDPVFVSIFIISFATRVWRIEYPRAVVFDELHYIKFITLYAKRIFFFDSQPPFGKQLMSIAAYLAGFNGDLRYSAIGDEYANDVPIVCLRLLPCLFGSLIAPITYLVSLELGFRQISASLVATLVVLENSLLTQSRYLLLEPILILFSILSIYSYLKFTHQLSIRWICLASISAALAASTKYSGLFSYTLLLGLTAYSWWDAIGRYDLAQFVRKSIAISIATILLPIIIYFAIYYAHLAWLTKAGPHDSIMTSAFQASLENGLASITRGQPLEISHGSQITLRHTHGRSCWLHSHEHLYPIKYPDGRGSSHQQQVTCYSYKDVNNWWIVKRPHIDELVVTEPHDQIKDNDIIQLIHGMTGRPLNSHDVASAMSPYSQEISCYVDHNISMAAQDVWRVRLINPQDTGGYWHTIKSQLQLIHLNSSLAMRFSNRQLPEWGFHQHEIVADKDLKNDDTIWNVEEHRHTKSEDRKEREAQLGQAEFLPTAPTSLTFFEKFYELHHKLFNYQQDAIKDHIYSSDSPIDWILLTKGTAYWVSRKLDDSAQIFLIGNVSTSLTGAICLVLFCVLNLFYSLRRRRQIYTDVNESSWLKFSGQATVLLSGYLVHLVPYFLYESPLFLQFYLNALVFKILIVGAIIDHVHDQIPGRYIHGIATILVAHAAYTYYELCPLSYGTSLKKDGLERLRWRETWQLITADNM